MRNPGMSVWVLAALSKISRASTPPELARAVQILNLLGLLALAFFSFRVLPEAEGVPWRWATVLAAVNPFAVLFHRKIWAQCTLPFFCVLFWMAWHRRQGRMGAFFLGFLGVCLGQIHMSGFFLAGGVFLWTLLHDRRFRWGFWFLGFLAGAVPLLPWLRHLAAEPGNGFGLSNLLWILYPKFWFYWVTDSLGLGLNYSLKTLHYLDFMRYPLLAGKATYLVAAAHAVLLAAGILIAISAWKNRGFLPTVSHSPKTGLALGSVFLASGVLMTLSSHQVFRHYLIMSFPLEWVWLSRLGLREPRLGPRWLMAIWTAQLFVSASFLLYIHANHGDPIGDYGIAYLFQSR